MSDLPEWLAALLASLGEGRDPDTVAEWTRRVRRELDRLAGRVPFQVVYDWHARLVTSMPDDIDDQDRVIELHRRVSSGDRVGATEWSDTLRPVLREWYRAAYPYAEAWAVAQANARAYATANGYRPDEVVEYAEYYANLSTGANAEAYANANAIANADAIGTALAHADESAYALTYPAALLCARALAEANRAGPVGSAQTLRAVYARLADELVDSLARVAV
ncbi:hypothetical protein GCM10027280_22600 [Micromonospora polyrhachis]|uniref:SpcZ n=1 Tax=Micromonospora polyrhachis TaxID=1282883 RepID=A0A7W7SXT4_9ACTN|nr:SpcZ [Micromonospora polyrhachis]MBB4962606.1 hypothetical protein [Micromonospora polyrhachis]